MTWWKEGRAKRSDAGPEVDGDHFAVKGLPDHWSLVMSGPTYSDGFGKTTCGGAPFAVFSVYAISPSGEFSGAARIEDEYIGCGADAPDDVDFTISPDWKLITHYYFPGAQMAGAESWAPCEVQSSGKTKNGPSGVWPPARAAS